MEVAVNLLLASVDSDEHVQLVSTVNPFADIQYSIQEAEVAVMFDVAALVEIGNAKSNLIGVSETIDMQELFDRSK